MTDTGFRFLRALFEHAKQHEPAIIFIDNVDVVMGGRNENISTHDSKVGGIVLQEMTKLVIEKRRVMFLGATNCPRSIDYSFRRLISKHIHIPLPTRDERVQLLRLFLRKCVHNLTTKQMETAASKMKNYSGANIKQLLRNAAYKAVADMDQKDIRLWKRVSRLSSS